MINECELHRDHVINEIIELLMKPSQFIYQCVKLILQNIPMYFGIIEDIINR